MLSRGQYRLPKQMLLGLGESKNTIAKVGFPLQRCKITKKRNTSAAVSILLTHYFDFPTATATFVWGTRRFLRNYPKWNIALTIGAKLVLLKTDAPMAIPATSYSTLTHIMQTL